MVREGHIHICIYVYIIYVYIFTPSWVNDNDCDVSVAQIFIVNLQLSHNSCAEPTGI